MHIVKADGGDHLFKIIVSVFYYIVVLLDYPRFYRKTDAPIPENRDKVLQDLKNEKFIYHNDGSSWDVSYYGALMIAADLKALVM